jgi:hypothetical protein
MRTNACENLRPPLPSGSGRARADSLRTILDRISKIGPENALAFTDFKWVTFPLGRKVGLSDK